MSKKIRIGDTFRRTYTRYNPLPPDPVTRKVLPNYDSPIDQSGQTARFVLVQGTTAHVYESADNVIFTPLAGKTEIVLTPGQTSLLEPSGVGVVTTSYLEFTDTATGEVESLFQRQEVVARKGAL